MTTILIVLLVVVFVGLSVALVAWGKSLLDGRDAQIAAIKRDMEGVRRACQQEIARKAEEAETALAHAQALVDKEREQLAQESERVRQHYEAEVRRGQAESRAAQAELMVKLQALQKYADLGDSEAGFRRAMSEAMDEAAALQKDAQDLLQQSRAAAAQERAAAQQRAKDIYEQAEARLNQATRDAGRIVTEAERRAEQIGGEAYSALRDKDLLEHAAAAIRNIVDGYGDRYVVPSHSILDDLAAEFGYDAAGESLRAARDQSIRMVEQGEAAACDYVEANRRETAIRFVIHAFNGHVDSLLTRVKHDNYGVLAQKIRDAFSLVNKDGGAFRNARILPAFLDARLAELRWAVAVQELALRAREEQRYQNERRRDEEKARKEQEEKLRQAQREEELKRAALEEAEKALAAAHADEKAKWQAEVDKLRQERDAALQKTLTIAQMTNVGRIYVISNVGSFGDSMYKVGMTRREAEERVYELGGASVPFEFDIHAVIESNDAPMLERKLHEKLLALRVNKMNPRKEFFRVKLSELQAMVNELKPEQDYLGTVTWTEKARAQQYYETLDIEGDAGKKEKWLARERAVATRRARADRARELIANGRDTALGDDDGGQLVFERDVEGQGG